jgi:hypothetical protein
VDEYQQSPSRQRISIDRRFEEEKKGANEELPEVDEIFGYESRQAAR